jgi:hypothetical protein
VDVKIIGNQDFDAMLARASNKIGARAETILIKDDPSQKYNKNQTIQLELVQIKNQGPRACYGN